ncbi:MAG: hypothetical protein ACI4E1_15050 [Lachnospira sp.]
MKKTIDNYRKEKHESVNIIVFSVILSTFINIISGALYEIYDFNPLVYVVCGSIVIVILILISLLYRIHKLNVSIEYKGMFIIDKHDKNRLINIPNYRINNDMTKYLKSSFVENKVIKKIWEEGDFQKFDFFQSDDKGRIYAKCDDSINLLLELIEYSLIENFSIFISDYFNALHLHSKVKKWSKDSIPDLLLTNRFLKLFSEDMNNRNIFMEDTEGCDTSTIECEGTVLVSYKNGALFRRFDLYLPKGTTIHKNDKNSITIDTKLFILTIHYLYGGFSTVVDKEFYKYYIGNDGIINYHPYQFNINISVKYKCLSAFKPYDWKYYNWLDEYINELEHYCNKNTFLNDIGWEHDKSLIRVLRNFKK